MHHQGGFTLFSVKNLQSILDVLLYLSTAKGGILAGIDASSSHVQALNVKCFTHCEVMHKSMLINVIKQQQMPASWVTKMTYHKGDSSSRCQGLEVSHMLAYLLRPSTCNSVHIVKLHTRYLSKTRRTQHLAMKKEKKLDSRNYLQANNFKSILEEKRKHSWPFLTKTILQSKIKSDLKQMNSKLMCALLCKLVHKTSLLWKHHFCLPPEGQEEVNLLVVLLLVVLGIISFFFHI